MASPQLGQTTGATDEASILRRILLVTGAPSVEETNSEVKEDGSSAVDFLSANSGFDHAKLRPAEPEDGELLEELSLEVYNQADLEQEVIEKVDEAMRVSEERRQEKKKKNEQVEDKSKLKATEKMAAVAGLINASDGETELQRKIRIGEMTPFGTIVGPGLKFCQSFNTKKKSEKKSKDDNVYGQRQCHAERLLNRKSKSFPQSTRNFFDARDKRTYCSGDRDMSTLAAKQSKPRAPRLRHNFSGDGRLSDEDIDDEFDYEERFQTPLDDDQDWIDDLKGRSRCPAYTVSSDEDVPKKSKRTAANRTKKRKLGRREVRGCDDGTEKLYLQRISRWKKEVARKRMDCPSQSESSEGEDEAAGGFTVPSKIWKRLYNYQRTGVRWLWELHTQQAGGILGDEMGLGKTIQVIGFLAGLRMSNIVDEGSSARYRGLGPVLIVAPATVLQQWVSELHKWWPPFRVAILHSCGTYNTSMRSLVSSIVESRSILVTSYSAIGLRQDILLPHQWHYVILDEGHKIRNPMAQVTIVCKQFRTCHRLILSGSPIQNNLKELWSLFDFVFPGKLGTLPDFMQHFSVPITHGGYANASELQVQTSYKCACTLRDTISPHLLRRMKADVQLSVDLPSKSEQVLFCRMTEDQKSVYQEYLASRECQNILKGNFMVFPGLITLRKICNHPDLATGGPNADEPNISCKHFGNWKHSGKMIVINSLLKLWFKQGHRVLLFSQSRKMLNILEKFVKQQKYSSMKMDGSTNIGLRQSLINQYNQDSKIFIFLLTTRVGGLGVNLTGANRVIIFDPDWNPSTDVQARERAWRLGQQRSVTIYRLLTTGTIEEKIYHRQIFKQFLTNRVLKDPKQRRFFKSNDLYELFTLNDDCPTKGTETSAIFAGMGSNVTVNRQMLKNSKNRFDQIEEEKKKRAAENIKATEEGELGDSSDNELLASIPIEELAPSGECVQKVPSRKIEDEMITGTVKQEVDLKMKVEVEREIDVKRDNDATQESLSEGEIVEEFSTTSLTENLSLTQGNDKNGRPDNTAIADQVVLGSGLPPVSTDLSEDAVSKLRKLAQKLSQNIMKTKAGSSSSRTSLDQHSGKDPARSKRKKLKKSRSLEGIEIDHLVKKKKYKSHQSELDEKSNNDYVLGKLLNKAGVHSAMKHDVIMDATNPDHSMVLSEASRVARQASSALKESRKNCHSAMSGIPNFTGSKMGTRKRFGLKNSQLLCKEMPSVMEGDKAFSGNLQSRIMDSDQLLKKIRTRNHFKVGEGSGSQEVGVDSIDLITDIRNFVATDCAEDGQATTQEILLKFKNQIPQGKTMEFKKMLYQICDFEKHTGIWRLKQDFK